MKRFVCMLLSALLLLSLPFGVFALEEDSGALILGVNSSVTYLLQFHSSREEVAQVQPIASAPTQEDGVITSAFYSGSSRIQGVAPGAAEITFTYSSLLKGNFPPCRFTLPVTVDENLKVHAGTEFSMSREEGSGWSFEMQQGDVLELTDQGGDGSDQTFTLKPLRDGFEEITFLRYDLEAQNSGVFICRLETQGEAVILHGINYFPNDSAIAFAPTFQFATTDFQGNEVTEYAFAGHRLTILNFWEPWCGPCVAEMPYLEQLRQEYASRGVQVIGVFATPDSDEEVQAVLDKTGATYPIWRYVKEFGFLQTGYVPTTVVIDRTGAIVYGPVAGALNYAGWCALVEDLL